MGAPRFVAPCSRLFKPLVAPLLLVGLALLAPSGPQKQCNSVHALKATKANDLLLVKQQPPVSIFGASQRDLRWPLRQVNVLVDPRSLNQTEQQILTNIFNQLEHRTCLHVHKLAPERVNPFIINNKNLNDLERNFIYIFKSQVGTPTGRHPSMGLSSLGCVRQGRQSMVLTELAFKWPELVLRYHVMRSLGVDNLERPDGHVRKLLNMLPLNQKITSTDELHHSTRPMDWTQTSPSANLISESTTNLLDKSPIFEFPTYFAYATAPTTAAQGAPSQQKTKSVRQSQPVAYLSESDLAQIKDLYNCTDYQNRLSPVPMSEILQTSEAPEKRSDDSGTPTKKSPSEVKLEEAEESLRGLLDSIENETSSTSGQQNSTQTKQINETLVEEAAKHIVDYLLTSDEEQRRSGGDGGSTGGQAKSIEDSDDRQDNNGLDSMLGSVQPAANSGECKPLESCPLEQAANGGQSPNPSSGPFDAYGNSLQERPMLLKLDDFHAQDPQLRQANQMKLSQFTNDSLATYRLMNNPSGGGGGGLGDFWLPPAPATADQQQQSQLPPPKSEMLISFEQANSQSRDPISALASSQVLKLCSCSCQTMTPTSNEPPRSPAPTQQSTTPAAPAATTTTPSPAITSELPLPTLAPATPTTTGLPPFTFAPFTFLPPIVYPTIGPDVYPTNPPVYPTIGPIIPTDGGVYPPTPDDYDYDDLPTQRPDWPATLPPWPSTATTTTEKPSTTTTPTTTTQAPTTTTTTAPTTTTEPSTTTTLAPTTTTTAAPTTTSTTTTTASSTTQSSSEPTSSANGLLGASACDSVEWVKPNKTVYASARIVWDVDRGNQNYFLCNNKLNGELIPGKTHGFSCKISQEGKEYETHNFNVLTKPEHVNLAWVQRDSNSFGRTNFPVVGGYSKQQDPYIVSRCLVKDENNDIITLIGYINNQGVGWFPFDDIQIECSQYDVLACVN